MARKIVPIVITEDQRKELTVMSRSLKLENRYVVRSKIILLSNEGKTMDYIERETGVSRKIVNKWRQRFREFGLDGLKDARRPGKKPTISAQQKAMVIQSLFKTRRRIYELVSTTDSQRGWDKSKPGISNSKRGGFKATQNRILVW